MPCTLKTFCNNFRSNLAKVYNKISTTSKQYKYPAFSKQPIYARLASFHLRHRLMKRCETAWTCFFYLILLINRLTWERRIPSSPPGSPARMRKAKRPWDKEPAISLIDPWPYINSSSPLSPLTRPILAQPRDHEDPARPDIAPRNVAAISSHPRTYPHGRETINRLQDSTAHYDDATSTASQKVRV